ncbi:helix-turn-helix domain-containing protein [Candidatus Pantoea persica]|uniref:helix-turn-helix domain-containing protein n=1 Tax=Candidatus Pantoea persica TaxID=2518128 RepID=UPI0035A950E8
MNQPRQVWPQREAGDVLAVDPCALSSAQQQQAKKLLESGHNRKQLALLYGVSLASIYKYCPVNRNARTGQNGFDEK